MRLSLKPVDIKYKTRSDTVFSHHRNLKIKDVKIFSSFLNTKSELNFSNFFQTKSDITECSSMSVVDPINWRKKCRQISEVPSLEIPNLNFLDTFDKSQTVISKEVECSIASSPLVSSGKNSKKFVRRPKLPPLESVLKVKNKITRNTKEIHSERVENSQTRSKRVGNLKKHTFEKSLFTKTADLSHLISLSRKKFDFLKNSIQNFENSDFSKKSDKLKNRDLPEDLKKYDLSHLLSSVI
jgi:hypothetical protein